MKLQFALAIVFVLAVLIYFIHQEYVRYSYEKKQREKDLSAFEKAMIQMEEEESERLHEGSKVNETPLMFGEYGSDESVGDNQTLPEGLKSSMENLSEAIDDFCEKEGICTNIKRFPNEEPLVKDYAFFIISPQTMVEYVETDGVVEINYQVYDGKDADGNDTFRYANYFSSDSFESHLAQAFKNGYERLV